MTSDTVNRTDRTFSGASPGAYMNFTCGRCHKKSPSKGSGYRRHRGVRLKVCAECKLPKENQ